MKWKEKKREGTKEKGMFWEVVSDASTKLPVGARKAFAPFSVCSFSTKYLTKSYQKIPVAKILKQVLEPYQPELKGLKSYKYEQNVYKWGGTASAFPVLAVMVSNNQFTLALRATVRSWFWVVR